jgi:hypothetical protein
MTTPQLNKRPKPLSSGVPAPKTLTTSRRGLQHGSRGSRVIPSMRSFTLTRGIGECRKRPPGERRNTAYRLDVGGIFQTDVEHRERRHGGEQDHIQRDATQPKFFHRLLLPVLCQGCSIPPLVAGFAHGDKDKGVPKSTTRQNQGRVQKVAKVAGVATPQESLLSLNSLLSQVSFPALSQSLW